MKYSIILVAFLLAACSGTTEPKENPLSGNWTRLALTTDIPLDTTVTVNGNFTGSPAVSTSPDSLRFCNEDGFVWQDGVISHVTANVRGSSVTLIYSQTKQLILTLHGDTLRSYPEDFVSLPAVYVRHGR